MNKKKYQKPHMVVYPLMAHKPLLDLSGETVHIPQINDNLNKLT